jgi:hypothetical protein
MTKPVVNLAAISNLVFKQMHFLSANDKEDLIALNKDSVILLARGKVLFTTDNATKEHVAPQILYVKARLKHSIESLTDNAVLYVVLPIKIDPEAGFVDYKNSVKTKELLDSINELVCQDESN